MNVEVAGAVDVDVRVKTLDSGRRREGSRQFAALL